MRRSILFALLASLWCSALSEAGVTSLGNYHKGATVRCPWNTTNAAGASVTRVTNGTLVAYIDGSTSETTLGITDLEDFDGEIGTHIAQIVTTDPIYTAGADILVMVKDAVVGTEAVSAFICQFSLDRPGRDGATIRRNVGGQRGFQVHITDPAGLSYTGAPGTVTVEVKKDAANFGPVSAPGGGVGLSGGGSGGDGHFLYTPSASDVDCAACVFRFLIGGAVRARVNVTTQP